MDGSQVNERYVLVPIAGDPKSVVAGAASMADMTAEWSVSKEILEHMIFCKIVAAPGMDHPDLDLLFVCFKGSLQVGPVRFMERLFVWTDSRLMSSSSFPDASTSLPSMVAYFML